MSSTHSPTRPMDVAELTAPEFTYELEWNDSLSFDEVCRRFGNDGNRAAAWLIRFRALHAWWARDGMARWLTDAAGTPRDMCEVAARLDLNDLGEFDAEAFCSAVDLVVAQRSPGAHR
jgi:hypothetical protein